MAGIDVSQGGGRKRSLDAEINMIPMIDLLMVTISFLLLTAVWSTQGRLDASAKAPSSNDTPIVRQEAERRTHLEIRVGKPVRMTIKTGESVLDSMELRDDEITAKVSSEWSHNGTHRDLNDPERDAVVLHAESDVRQADVVRVMDAVAAVKRGKTPALRVIFAQN
jgi:biopolymer transport protein ExbD